MTHVVSDLDRLKRAKIERDDSAYKRGFKEAWDQAIWLIFGIAIVIAWVTW